MILIPVKYRLILEDFILAFLSNFICMLLTESRIKTETEFCHGVFIILRINLPNFMI
jgi:hypothetical protein